MNITYRVFSQDIYNADIQRILDLMEIGFLDHKVMHVYMDSVGHPTIGVGFDLAQVDSRNWVFDSFGITDSQQRATLTADITQGGSESVIKTALDAHMAQFHLVNPSIRATFEFATMAEMNETLTNYFTASYEATVDRVGVVDPAVNSIERAALLTEYYVGLGSSWGRPLRETMNHGDRAEAWYHLRYEMNVGQPGYPERHYISSNYYGLYNSIDDFGYVSVDDAKSAYQMYSHHMNKIQQYDHAHESAISTANQKISYYNNTYGASYLTPVETTDDILDHALQTLLHKYVPETSDPIIAAIRGGITNAFVEFTPDASPENNIGELETGSYTMDRSSESKENALFLTGSGNDTVHAGGGDDIIVNDGANPSDTKQLFGDAGNDVIVGSTASEVHDKGAVHMDGGDGDDILFAGAGGAVMTGGRGADTFWITEGSQITDFEVDDTIVWYDPSNPANPLNGTVLKSSTPHFFPGRFDLSLGWWGSTDAHSTSYFWSFDSVDSASVSLFLFGDTTKDPVTITSKQYSVHITPIYSGPDIVSNGGEPVFMQVGSLVTGADSSGQGGGAPQFGGDNGDVLTGLDSNNIFFGEGGNDTIMGNGGDDYIDGGLGNDTIDGGTGTNIVNAGLGDDVILAGLGSNTYYGGSGFDTVSYQAASSGITVSLATTSAQTVMSGIVDTFSSDVEGLIGSNYNDTLTGSGNADTLKGGAGNDTLFGGSGEDTLDGGTGNDTLNGEAGADTLIGGLGTNTLNGGTEFDFVSYQSATAGVTVSLVLVTAQTVMTGVTDTLSGIEGLMGSNYADRLTGDASVNTLYGFAGNDILTGGTGNDTLDGGTGNDTLDGGTGTDTVDYSASTSGIKVNISTVSQTLGGTVIAAGLALDGVAGTDTLISIESVAGTAYDDFVIGNASANTFIGGAGNDTLDSGDGADTLWGGTGNDVLLGGNAVDTILYTDSTSAVYINLRSVGSQLVNDQTLAANIAYDGLGGTDTLNGIQNVTGSLTADTNVWGGVDDNVITTYGGYDWINGDAGNDTITTGNGIDTLIGGAGNDILTAGADDDFLDGGAGNDTLNGGAGADTLIGGLGTNTLTGGTEFDIVSYDWATAGITASLALTTAQTVMTGVIDTFSGIEGLIGSNYNDTFTGSTGVDTLKGLAGNDALSGGSGNDTLDGGDGNDTLDGGAGADTLIGGLGTNTLTGGTEFDFVSYEWTDAGVTASLALTTAQTVMTGVADTISTVEGLIGSNYNDTLTGNASANTLVGLEGDDILNGGTGTDTVDYSASVDGIKANISTVSQTLGGTVIAAGTALDGLYGTDTLILIESVTGTAYDDFIYGNASGNTFIGGDGNDTLDGGSGADTLWGGAGNDILLGGNEVDTLVYTDSTGAVYINLRSVGSQLVNDQTIAEHTAIDGLGGTDTLSGMQNVTGSQTAATNVWGGVDANTITTYAGNDWINADAGNDILNTGAGNDILNGGAGNDSLTGGAGLDTFIWSTGGGTDTITDFQDGLDILKLTGIGATFASFVITDTAAGAQVALSGSAILVLNGVLASQLQAADFAFA